MKIPIVFSVSAIVASLYMQWRIDIGLLTVCLVTNDGG